MYAKSHRNVVRCQRLLHKCTNTLFIEAHFTIIFVTLIVYVLTNLQIFWRNCVKCNINAKRTRLFSRDLIFISTIITSSIGRIINIFIVAARWGEWWWMKHFFWHMRMCVIQITHLIDKSYNILHKVLHCWLFIVIIINTFHC